MPDLASTPSSIVPAPVTAPTSAAATDGVSPPRTARVRDRRRVGSSASASSAALVTVTVCASVASPTAMVKVVALTAVYRPRPQVTGLAPSESAAVAHLTVTSRPWAPLLEN